MSQSQFPERQDYSIVPSSIFGQDRQVAQKFREGLDGRIQEIAIPLLKYIREEKPELDSLREYSFKLVGSDIQGQEILYIALKSINTILEDPAQRKMVEALTDVLFDALYNPTKTSIKTKLDQLSPKEVSLKEGVLPEINPKHRELIGKYLRGEKGVDHFVEKIGLNRDTAKEILTSIKVMDLEINRYSRAEKESLGYQSTYPLRMLCLQESNGSMNSYEAFTYSIKPEYFGNPFSPVARDYASHEYNYVPERVAEHRRVAANYGIEMMQLSQRLDLPPRVFYCLGGNSGVGKSRCANTDLEFQKGLVDGEIVGALNLDSLKGKLRKGIPKVTNQQIHVEGWAVAQKLAKELKTKAIKTSIVIDERLGTVDSVKDVIKLAEQTDAKVRYKDIDGSLLVSSLRVLGRDIKTEPCLPFQPIADGQTAIRSQRRAVVEMIKSSPSIESYQLFVANRAGEQVLVAEKKGGRFIVHDQELLDSSMNMPTKAEIELLRDTKIDSEFLRQISLLPGVKVAEVKKYEGKTLGEALDLHSKEMPLYR